MIYGMRNIVIIIVQFEMFSRYIHEDCFKNSCDWTKVSFIKDWLKHSESVFVMILIHFFLFKTSFYFDLLVWIWILSQRSPYSNFSHFKNFEFSKNKILVSLLHGSGQIVNWLTHDDTVSTVFHWIWNQVKLSAMIYN